MTAEQQARDLLDRMEVPDAQSYSAGELVELANLIAEVSRLRAQETRIRELHWAANRGIRRVCRTCNTTYPCPTIAALDAEEEQ